MQPVASFQGSPTKLLSQIEGELHIAGLHAPVEILRDTWGIPHIYAQNQDDLFFAQGFVAAQDRLWQIDLWRRIAIGECAQALGPQALPIDRLARLVRYRGDMQAEWESYSPQSRQIAESFVRGINAAIDQIGERLPIEFQLLGYRPGHWRAEDVLGRTTAMSMMRNFDAEVLRAQVLAHCGPEVAQQLVPTDPPRAFSHDGGFDPAVINGALLEMLSPSVSSLDFASLCHAQRSDESNNWVVAVSHSQSGKPLLASDPHRRVTLPALRYLVHLHAPGWNVIGAGEPGLPGVSLGHNEHIAWGFTISGHDQSDLVVETLHPTEAHSYRVGDSWQPIEVIRERVQVRGEAEPVEVELCFTRHGPVVHVDEQRRLAVALQWVGREPGTAPYLASLRMNQAKSVDEFREAASLWKTPSHNLVYADVDGQIGWVAAGLMPLRGGDGLLPVAGASGEHLWRGFLPAAELPQEFNPSRGWIATANHNILPADYKHQIAYEWAPSFRYERAQELLEAKKLFDLDDMCRMQIDQVSLRGRALAQIVATIKLNDTRLDEALAQLAAWDGSTAVDSHAAVLSEVWWRELEQEYFGSRLPAELIDFAKRHEGAKVLLVALTQQQQPAMGNHPLAHRDALVRTTLDRALKKIAAAAGSNASGSGEDGSGEDRQAASVWGEWQQTRFRHPLASLPLDEKLAPYFELPAMPRGGDPTTLDVTYSDADFVQLHGATYRQVFDLADWDRGLATSAPGQSGQPGSPHYGDLAPLWQRGEYFPLYFSRTKVEEAARHRLVLTPR